MAVPLPKDSFPYFKGYSVGRWENGTLVFETVGLKPSVWLDARAATVSEDARLTEQIRPPDYGHLEVQITVNDPETYTRPWTATRYLEIALDTELIPCVCDENKGSARHMGRN